MYYFSYILNKVPVGDIRLLRQREILLLLFYSLTRPSLTSLVKSLGTTESVHSMLWERRQEGEMIVSPSTPV